MKVGSLFSGIGGIELGFEREGFETKWFVESEPFCQAVLRKNFPRREIYGDIRKIKWDEVEQVDVLTGGFPCQDLSLAGKRKGLVGERSGLWKEYARAIREIQPRYAVIENVPGLISLGLDEVIKDIAEIGYDAEWTTLRASDFGALHKRERVFIIAYPDSGDVEAHGETRSSQEVYRAGENFFNAEDDEQREHNPSHADNDERRIIGNEWEENIASFRNESINGPNGFGWCAGIQKVADLNERNDIPKPLLRGSRNGFPNWVDRIKSCGNAVVPQVAQFIARKIKEKEGVGLE